ncbi:hypothetical protein CGC21_15085 [Leishmania donovani]|uniref:Uncharacterized protein n=1 Tax=Leishmania donovani TaxID=5661 RepID=A0A504XU82_LEIDO|nr:hypothetical protein CGC21_15085 [Leishmania donovani]
MLYANNTPIGTAAKCCGLRASSDGAEGEAVELGLDMLRRQLEQPRHGKTSVGVATDSLSLLMALGAGPTRVTDGMLRCIGAQLHGLLTGLVVTGRRRQVQHPPKPRTTRCGPRRQATLLARLRTSTCPHFGFLQRQDGAQTVCRPPTLLALWCPQPRQRLDPHPLSAVRAADPALCRACDARLAGCSRRKAHLVPRYDAARTGVMTHMLTHGSVPPSRRMWANPFRLAATTSTEMEEDARHPDSCGTGAGSMAYGRVAEALKGSHRRLADLFLELIRHAGDGELLVSPLDTFRYSILSTAWDPRDEYIIAAQRSGFQLFGASSWLADGKVPCETSKPVLELKSATVQARLGGENRISFGLLVTQFLGSSLNTICGYSGAQQLDIFDLEDLDEATGEPLRTYNLRALRFDSCSPLVSSVSATTAVVTVSDAVAVAALSNGCTALVDLRKEQQSRPLK